MIRKENWSGVDVVLFPPKLWTLLPNHILTISQFIPDLISRSSIQRALSVSSEWTHDENNSTQSTVQYAFRVTCDAHYYGDRCANLCRPREDGFGHYTCSSTGERICLSGWQGDYCDKRKLNFSSAVFFFWKLISNTICLHKIIEFFSVIV